ncbi:heme biosynthesis protein [Pseudoalteromonas ruthenica]|uniref:heme biosynthesis HemY N-terminal domain-containing protein n=1 Tax=Pseudoalteromonas ruthenica TaxID=151081 RepID=UPI0011081BA0|nr:heme biosynthesis HemY N-terminal domain-containing protein [Pseudoalteromonas ruthenica]TLX51459.1 heme biosynthesis protein [Pseudoalteromonas ruthenica]
MARLLIVFIVIAAVAAIAPWLIDEKGYVLIAFGQWTVEGSIVSFTILTALALFLGYLIYSLVRYGWGSYRNLRHGFFARAKERKQAVLEQAIWALINDDMEQLQHTLSKGKVEDHWQDFALAMRAKASLRQDKPDLALNLLDELSDTNRAKPAALWLESHSDAEVLATLRQQCSSKKATSQQLNLYAQVLLRLRKYSEFAELVPRLVKSQSLNEYQWDWALRQYFQGADKTQLDKRQNELPKHIREAAHTHYLRAVVRIGDIASVTDALKKLLKRGEYSQLLSILSEIEQGDVEALQKALQQELKKQPDEAEMLLCLAYLAQSQGEHDLASRIFDKVLAQQQTLPHPQRAMRSYRATQQAEKALLVLDHS